MIRASILTMVAVVCLIATIVASQRAIANPAVYELGSDPMVGFNLITWWDWGSSGTSTWQNAVDQVYNAGFREISISPVRYFNTTTGVISATNQQSPQLSHIEAAVVRAKSLGMRVTLNPFVEPENFSTWRHLQPDRRQRFVESILE